MVDWSHGAAHMHRKHGVTVDMANEALSDGDAVVFDPDFASNSGKSTRTIGYSSTAAAILVVITVRERGMVYGANGWRANETNARYYSERTAQ